MTYDTKVFKVIQSSTDAVNLQKDINNLKNWSTAHGLQLIQRNQVQSTIITYKINPIPATYSMNNTSLARIKHERNLDTLRFNFQQTYQRKVCTSK